MQLGQLDGAADGVIRCKNGTCKQRQGDCRYPEKIVHAWVGLRIRTASVLCVQSLPDR
ncbi:hypothetical protein ETAE_1654 [Edwardsiella piscicida]|nr:hypothetical protein ETAE_1654 [Edwardsiella tarda EIB202]